MTKTKEIEKTTEKERRVTFIPVESIMPNRCQPRTRFEQESLERLSASIKEYGIIQPLTVRENPEKSNFSSFQYELIAGERRLRAAKAIGIKEVPCIIIESDTKKSAEMAIIENLHRDDLNIFEEAAAIASLIALHKLTQEQIALQLSLTQASIANKLRLLKLSEPEKAVILSNNLTERHARALLRVKSAEDRQRILSHVVAHSLNVKQTEEYIDRLITPPDAREETRVYTYQNLLHGITRAIELTRSGGLTVRTLQTETDSDIIYTIQIPKPITQ